jgi:alpha-L-fucosidase
LYIIFLGWSDKELIVRSIDENYKVDQVSMLGSDEELTWSQTDEGLKVLFPKKKPTEHAHSLKITFK